MPDPARRRAHFARMDVEIPSPTRAVGDEPQRVTLKDIDGGHLVAV